MSNSKRKLTWKRKLSITIGVILEVSAVLCLVSLVIFKSTLSNYRSMYEALNEMSINSKTSSTWIRNLSAPSGFSFRAYEYEPTITKGLIIAAVILGLLGIIVLMKYDKVISKLTKKEKVKSE